MSRRYRVQHRQVLAGSAVSYDPVNAGKNGVLRSLIVPGLLSMFMMSGVASTIAVAGVSGAVEPQLVVKQGQAQASSNQKAKVTGDSQQQEDVLETGPVRGEHWLKQQPLENYTLQLMVSENREAVEFVARQRNVSAPRAVAAIEKDGRIRYALFQGSYHDRTGAEAAASDTEENLKPWIRSFESVMPELKSEATAGRKKSKVHRDPRAAGNTSIKDTAWIWSRNPANYAIQLAAARNEQGLEARMRKMALPGEMAVVQTLSRGQRWYVLIFGNFSSYETARSAIVRLPASLQQANPWPRSFASLQDELSRSTPSR